MACTPAAAALWRPDSSALSHDLSAIPGPARALCRGLVLTLGRLAEIDGVERLTGRSGPVIFALNHSNAAETVIVQPLLLALTGRPVHFLVDWMFAYLPVAGWLIRRSDPILVYTKRARFGLFDAYRRRRAHASVIDACLARLEDGGQVALFPEGTRNGDPQTLLPARKGLGEIVLRSAAPVVPLGLTHLGAGRGKTPVLGRVRLTVGEPLDFAAERRAAAEAAPLLRRELARRAAGLVMTEISRLAGKAHPPARRPRAAAVLEPQPEAL